MRSGSQKLLILLPMLAAFACGGGGGGDAVVDNSPSPVVAAFRPDEPTPPNSTAAMLQGQQNADVVTVKATVTNVTGIYAAAFDVLYDETKATYIGFSPGTLLEQGSHSPTYQVRDTGNGRVVVAATRNGNVGTVNAAGTVTIVNLTFRVKAVGESRADFAPNPILYDGQLTPQPKTGIFWTAGALVGHE